MVITAESKSEVEQIPRCSQGGELIVNTNRGLRSLAPSSLGLKFLRVRGNYYNQVIGDLSRDLVWLQWFDIEQRNLGSLNSLKNLRVLELHQRISDGENQLEELWETESNAPLQLRELLIYNCKKFQRFPKSIGCLSHLKKIVANNTSVRSLPDEFCLLQSLEHLELSECRELSLLPNNFGDLRNLRHLHLRNCSELMKLPVSLKGLALLQHLSLSGCVNLSLELDMLETMTLLEFLDLSRCRQLEELPRHITNQASLRELNLEDAERLREIPANIGQLSKLRMMMIGNKLLESLPTSIGDLSSLTYLQISSCPKLGCLPESLGRLNHLQLLVIQNSGVKSLANIVRKTSISEDCCPGLEYLWLVGNSHLTEIDVLPTTLKSMVLRDCKMVRNIRSIDGLVNIQTLIISGCPELDSLPSFAQLACLHYFELRGCYGVKKIQGLEYCRALQTLTVHTRWEEAGIQSLECMERLKDVSLKAISRAGVEGCIRSMQKLQKWPDRIVICTRAVTDAASLLNSFDFSKLSVVDSFANQKVNCRASVKWSFSSARCILVCFVVNCESPKTSWAVVGDTGVSWNDIMEFEEGKWVWTGVFTQHSKIHNNIPLHTQSTLEVFLRGEDIEGEVEKGLVVTGEEERVVEAFTRLCMFLSD